MNFLLGYGLVLVFIEDQIFIVFQVNLFKKRGEHFNPLKIHTNIYI